MHHSKCNHPDCVALKNAESEIRNGATYPLSMRDFGMVYDNFHGWRRMKELLPVDMMWYPELKHNRVPRELLEYGRKSDSDLPLYC